MAAPAYTRCFTSPLHDGDRKRYLTRESKRLARLYGGNFNSHVGLETRLAEYRVSYPAAKLITVAIALRRREARR